MATFNISKNWIDWAHGPGAESDQPMAEALCAMPANKRGQIEIPDGRRDMIEEVMSVAELYIYEPDYRLQANRVVNRCREFLKQLDEKYPLSSALDRACRKAGI